METAAVAENRNGIIRVLDKENRSYYTAQDVMELLGIGRSKASSMIRELRNELVSSGALFEGYPVGRIPKKYFRKRCGME